MTGWGKRLSVFLVVALFLTFSIMSVVSADIIAEKVQAYLGVKVLYNGQELRSEKQPYIINDTTYVPLRMLMDNFDKSISFDSSSKKVIIKDKENTNITSLNKKIEELNAKITSLQKENTKLESENTSLTKKIEVLMYDDEEIKDIEDELYEDYEDAGDDYFDDADIYVEIILEGDEDDLEFEIYFDFSDSDENDDLTDLSTASIKSMMKAIYADIEEYIDDTDYEDADITGILEDDEDNYVEYEDSSFDFNW